MTDHQKILGELILNTIKVEGKYVMPRSEFNDWEPIGTLHHWYKLNDLVCYYDAASKSAVFYAKNPDEKRSA